MTVKLIVDNVEVPIKVVKFSDGGSNVKLQVPEYLIKYPPNAYYSITIDPSTPADSYVWELALVHSAVDEMWGWNNFKKTILNLPYLPHARADRVFEAGNAFPLKIFFQLIEYCFDEVFLTDPHSNYYEQYQRSDLKFIVREQYECFLEICGKLVQSGDVLIAPDKGSLSKIYKLQQKLDVKSVATFIIEAGKKRDVGTGRVIETTLPEGSNVEGKVCWIADDIIAGGGTFIPLAKKLKDSGAKEVNLYITHGIFDKGLDILGEYIDNIYTYQIVGNYVSLKDIEQFNQEI